MCRCSRVPSKMTKRYLTDKCYNMACARVHVTIIIPSIRFCYKNISFVRFFRFRILKIRRVTHDRFLFVRVFLLSFISLHSEWHSDDRRCTITVLYCYRLLIKCSIECRVWAAYAYMWSVSVCIAQWLWQKRLFNWKMKTEKRKKICPFAYICRTDWVGCSEMFRFAVSSASFCHVRIYRQLIVTATGSSVHYAIAMYVFTFSLLTIWSDVEYWFFIFLFSFKMLKRTADSSVRLHICVRRSPVFAVIMLMMSFSVAATTATNKKWKYAITSPCFSFCRTTIKIIIILSSFRPFCRLNIKCSQTRVRLCVCVSQILVIGIHTIHYKISGQTIYVDQPFFVLAVFSAKIDVSPIHSIILFDVAGVPCCCCCCCCSCFLRPIVDECKALFYVMPAKLYGYWHWNAIRCCSFVRSFWIFAFKITKCVFNVSIGFGGYMDLICVSIIEFTSAYRLIFSQDNLDLSFIGLLLWLLCLCLWILKHFDEDTVIDM